MTTAIVNNVLETSHASHPNATQLHSDDVDSQHMSRKATNHLEGGTPQTTLLD